MPKLLQSTTAKNIFHSDAGDIKPQSEAITVKNAAGSNYEPGQVMGIITSSGLAVARDQTATDGSQVPAGILAEFVNATTATGTGVDTPALMYIGEAKYLTDKLIGLDKQVLKQLGGVSVGNNLTHLGCGHEAPLSVVTGTDADITVAAGTDVLLVPTLTAPRTINLPTVAAFGYNNTLKISTINANAQAPTLDGSGSETINGSATWAFSLAHQAVTLLATSAGWRIIS